MYMFFVFKSGIVEPHHSLSTIMRGDVDALATMGLDIPEHLTTSYIALVRQVCSKFICHDDPFSHAQEARSIHDLPTASQRAQL